MNHRSLTSVTSFPKHTRTQRPRGASEPSVRICSLGGKEGFWAFPASFGPSETSALLPHQNEICQDRAWVPSPWRPWGLHTANAMEKLGPHTSGSPYPRHHQGRGRARDALRGRGEPPWQPSLAAGDGEGLLSFSQSPR